MHNPTATLLIKYLCVMILQSLINILIRYLQPRTNVTNPYNIINDDQHSKFTDIVNDIMSLFIVSIYLSLN